MISSTSSLTDLRHHFLATSTQSMPIAGTIYWAVVAIAALFLPETTIAYVVLFGSGMIFPFAILIDKLTGKNKIKTENASNPILQLFLRSIIIIALLWPLAIIAARAAEDPLLIVLGGAILMGIIWIPYGWGADDPVGMEHAIGRSIGSYAAYLLAPAPYTATAISVVVLLSYLYSFVRMRRPQ